MKILTVAASQWVFGFNDPSIIAWVIVCFYFLGTFFCWRAQSSLPVQDDAKKRILWITLAIFLLLLGFNKQLDLHDLIMEGVRDMSSNERQSIAGKGGLSVFLIAIGGVAIWLGNKFFSRPIMSCVGLTSLFSLYFSSK